MRTIRPWLWLLLLALLTGCASTGGEPSTGPSDPLEGVNRGVYGFNEVLDDYALAPAARGWTRITTPGVRDSVGNFFDNLAAPGVVLNNLLQGKFRDASATTARFLVNSTVGVLGLFDPADRYLGIAAREEDFGQTLGVWGVENRPYLVVPLFGPSSGRDVTRYPVGYYTNVLTYVALDTVTMGAFTAVNVINTRAQLDRAARLRDESAIDPYAFTRSAYLQYREQQVYDGNPPQDEDPYGDFFDELESGD
ncbi:MlaA family lipoprotein [Spiribacter halobius]|uniref:MlaA family lipoprotein n=1 Tax=Sediminicurvatus halobius TaxID=2182432 RepID=UPI001E3DF22E|nr:VacJ family lipoprotein [Spiribacter halobius]UEX78299.1 VacJ family lipoprotein [Spiribacter halobius]